MIAPLSANTLAKLAHGLADNVLTQLALAFRGPFLVAPAMNVRMWEHPATRANVETLCARGVELIGPEAGELAEGEEGMGRMSEPEAIFARVRELLGESDTLAGKRVLVTAGGTREPLDSVRFVGNRSSGRMGVALAEEARQRGARGDAARREPRRSRARRRRGRRDPDCRRPRARGEGPRRRRRRADGRRGRGLRARAARRQTAEVRRGLAARRCTRPRTSSQALGESKNGTVLVGFGAEAGDEGLERKRRMLADKHLDLVVFNDVSRDDIGFDASDNEVVLVSAPAASGTIGKAPKGEIAAAILDEVERLL